jgi:hypothetical protein
LRRGVDSIFEFTQGRAGSAFNVVDVIGATQHTVSHNLWTSGGILLCVFTTLGRFDGTAVKARKEDCLLVHEIGCERGGNSRTTNFVNELEDNLVVVF